LLWLIKNSVIVVKAKGGKMFRKVSNRNVVFTLPYELNVVLQRLKLISRNNLKNLLILASLIALLCTKPATAQVKTSVIQTAAVAVATQTPTDEDTQKQIDELIAQIEHYRPTVRLSAADALAKIGQPAVQPLIKALENENNHVRFAAARGLGKIGDPQAVDPLIKTLEDENWLVRVNAAEALGEIGDPQAVQPLSKSLSDRYYKVSRSAI